MSTILEVSNVDQYFRVGFWMKRVQVLHDIQLRVPEKSVFGFLGANGAGKTTLIHLITGLRSPTAGQVRLRGLDTVSLRARSMIGYLPERPYFHEHLTASGLLHYFGALAGLSRVQIRSRIPVVLSQVGMLAAKEIELKRFSKGMLQRVGIAQALIHDPEFLVLDEPMSGLDPIGRKEMRELIQNLANEGRTLFFSSHVIPDVEAVCTQVAVIQRGRLLGYGPLEQLLNQGTFVQGQESLPVPILTEIAFGGVSAFASQDWPEFKSVRSISRGHIGVVEGPENVNRALERLIRQNLPVLWVSPVRRSLENLFIADQK